VSSDVGRAADSDRLLSGERLLSGRQLVSRSGSFRFVMQGDGNLVLYGPYGAIWASSTFVRGTGLVMQGDGNLVAYAPGGRAVWNSGTVGSGARQLVVQGDGNVVLYRADGRAVWSTRTVRAVPLRYRGQDVTVVPTTQRVVALTFDAGANSAGLPSILATLASRGVKATFFLTGQWAQADPSGVTAIRAGGHRIGNHSMTHPHFLTLTDAQIRAQVFDAERTILGAGADPRILFRFPFGERAAHTIAVVNGVGYVPVRWTVDTLGWKGTSGGITVQTVVDRALGSLRPGEIVLMHIGSNPDDGSTLDAAALPSMIDRMRAAGYGFTTLDGLFR
jgi:peptidoglycan/xylan/chitin deacetylase (PgdA/CDA1 family)